MDGALLLLFLTYKMNTEEHIFCDYFTQFRINSAPFVIKFREILFTPEITALNLIGFYHFLIYEGFLQLGL